MAASASSAVSAETSISVDTQMACDATGVPSDQDMQAWVELAVAASARQLRGPSSVAVRVVAADEMQTLNKTYREQDTATNVLSFPADDIDGLPDSEQQMLGDIVVCAAVVATEAADQGKALSDHWAHMLVHGTLHLLGYDHAVDADAELMESLEAKILAHRGIPNPYASS